MSYIVINHSKTYRKEGIGMSTTTKNLGLIKPDPSEYFDIQVFNDNMAVLDEAIGTSMSDIVERLDRIESKLKNSGVMGFPKMKYIATETHTITSNYSATAIASPTITIPSNSIIVMFAVMGSTSLQSGTPSDVTLSNPGCTFFIGSQTPLYGSVAKDNNRVCLPSNTQNPDSKLYAPRMYSSHIFDPPADVVITGNHCPSALMYMLPEILFGTGGIDVSEHVADGNDIARIYVHQSLPKYHIGGIGLRLWYI